MAAGIVLVAGTGVASAKPGGHPGGSGSVSGSITCRMNASLSFSPSLMSTSAPTNDSTVMLNIQLVQCNSTAVQHRTTGHVSPMNLGTIPTDTCTLPTSMPAFTGMAIRWTPTSKVQGSTVSSTATGAVTTLGTGMAQVAYNALAVTGSFATSSTPGTAALTTRDTVSALQSACQGSGLSDISLSGSATL
jgi:hypothetical protein